jgi:hypothetical protein
MTGRTSRDGRWRERDTSTPARPCGLVSPNDQTGWSPVGAAMVTRTRDPAR